MSSITEVLDTVDNVLMTIKNIADMPGVNLIPYVSTASSVISIIHAAHEAGKAVTPYIEAVKKTFDGDKPTDEELAALNAKIEELEAAVDAPLPPKEEGEED